MSKCKCFDSKPSGESLLERLPACTCQCKSGIRLSAEENGRKFVLITDNWEKVQKVKVDGALIYEQTTEKCDYFFFYNPDLKEKKREAYFVELKGKNISKAINQIMTTLQLFIREGIMTHISLQKAFVVSSRVPQTDRKIEKLKEDMKKNHKCPVKIKNDRIEYKP